MSEFNNATQKSWECGMGLIFLFFMHREIFARVSPNERKLGSTGKSQRLWLGPTCSTSWVCFQPSRMSHRGIMKLKHSQVIWKQKGGGAKGSWSEKKKTTKKKTRDNCQFCLGCFSVASQLIDYIGKSQCSLISYRFCPQYWRFWRRMIIIKTW